MKKLIALLLLFLLCTGIAAAVDQKSLLLGVGIGAGLVVSKNYTVIPAAKATKRAAKAVGHGAKKSAGATLHYIKGDR